MIKTRTSLEKGFMIRKRPLNLQDLKLYYRATPDLPTDAIWAIIYREVYPRPMGQNPFHRMWEVFATSDQDEAWAVHRKFVAGSNPRMTDKSLAVLYRREQFGEGDYGESC